MIIDKPMVSIWLALVNIWLVIKKFKKDTPFYVELFINLINFINNLQFHCT